MPVDLLRPPAMVPAARSVLGPLLPGAYTPEAWEGRRAELQGEWTRILGGFPQTKVALAPDSGFRQELASFTRQRVTYQIEEGVRTDAMLLIPKGAAGAATLASAVTTAAGAASAGAEPGGEPPDCGRCG